MQTHLYGRQVDNKFKRNSKFNLPNKSFRKYMPVSATNHVTRSSSKITLTDQDIDHGHPKCGLESISLEI